jgi:peroxisomal 2,4-dienoyl-CoA reductase
VRYTLEQFGKLDILVNGAAGNFLAPAKTLKPKGFSTVMSIDALGTFNMCSAAFDALQRNGGGGGGNGGGDPIIINISATLQCPATYYQVHASAAKAAVDSITRSLALEWGPYKIRVVGIAPGPIADTPGTTKLAPNMDSSGGSGGTVSNLIEQGIPLGRMGTATEIGHAAVFLCTSKYTTGDTFIVDGGEWLHKKPPMISPDKVEQLSRAVEKKSRSQAPKANHAQQQQQSRL